MSITELTVLYIEDNAANAALVERILARRPDTRLHVATQGATGLELATSLQPDIILLDLHLPDISGDIVLQRLQASPRTRGIPVIIVSADATPAQIDRLRQNGANEYLTKPLDIHHFLAVIDATAPRQISSSATASGAGQSLGGGVES